MTRGFRTDKISLWWQNDHGIATNFIFAFDAGAAAATATASFGVNGEEEGVDLVAHHAATVQHTAPLPVHAEVGKPLHRRRRALRARQSPDVPRALRQPVDGHVRWEHRRLPPQPSVPRSHRRRLRLPHHSPHRRVERVAIARHILHVVQDERVAGVGLPDEILIVVPQEAVVVPVKNTNL